jgi:hypothetical protein
MLANRAIRLALATGAVALMASATPAVASVTVGAPLLATGFGDAPCGATCRLTMLQAPASGEGGAYAAPFDGTIVRWRIQTAAGSSPETSVWLRVLRHVSGNKWAGVATGEPNTLSTEAATQAFPADLPVEAGEYIALDQNSKAHFHAYGAPGADGELFHEIIFALEDGHEAEASAGLSSTEDGSLLINADVARLPTTTETLVQPCGPATVGLQLTTDADPATAPKAIHYRIDGGPETTAPTTGNPGLATFTLPIGYYALEYWGEDAAGGQDATHHSQTVVSEPCLGGDWVPEHPFAPVIASASVAPYAFRAAAHGQAFIAAHVGALLTYRDNRVATTTIALARLSSGHRVGRTCHARKPTKHQRPCTRTLVLAASTHPDAAGWNSLRLTGRLRGRGLPPGRYELTLTPVANGVSGAAVTVPFHIVP